MTHLLRATGVLVLLLAMACEKGGDSKKGATGGAMSETERALFAYLPTNANVVFGGNYKKLMEYWKTSPLKALTETALAAGAAQPNGVRDYMTCWVEKKPEADLVGALEIASGGVNMTMVMKGVSADLLTECAEKGGFQTKRDPDGKYMELQGLADGRGGTTSAGYYFVAPDTAFFAIEMPLSVAAGGTLPPPSRAKIEEQLEKIKAAPASGSAQIQALVAAADRSKPIWMAGTGAGTPLANKIGKGHGWLDADKDSLTIAFSIELLEEGAASKAVSEFDKVKAQIGALPPELKQAAEAFLADAKLTASGKVLSGQFKITNDLLNKVAPFLTTMGAGGL